MYYYYYYYYCIYLFIYLLITHILNYSKTLKKTKNNLINWMMFYLGPSIKYDNLVQIIMGKK